MLHIFTIEYRGMAPTLPVDVYGTKYDELQVATFFLFVRKTHHLKTKTKDHQRIGGLSVKLCNPFQRTIASAMSAGARHIKNLEFGVECSGDDVFLLWASKLYKVDGIAGYSNCELWVFFWMFHCVQENFALEDIDI